MDMAARKLDNLTVVELEGPRLDASCAERFKSELKQIIDAGETRIVLDFSKVFFMDSSGLGAVVGCLKYMGTGGSIEIAAPTAAITKVLRLTRMNKVFNVREEPPAASGASARIRALTRRPWCTGGRSRSRAPNR